MIEAEAHTALFVENARRRRKKLLEQVRMQRVKLRSAMTNRAYEMVAATSITLSRLEGTLDEIDYALESLGATRRK